MARRRIVDLSIGIEAGLPSDPPMMIPRVDYIDHAMGTASMLEFFPGLKQDQLPGGVGWAVEFLTLCTHSGTHLDAPVHWITGRDGVSVDRIAASRLVGPVVVIDKADEVAADADFALAPADFEAWIAEHGELPDGCWVLFRTGWSARSARSTTTPTASPSPARASSRWLPRR